MTGDSQQVRERQGIFRTLGAIAETSAQKIPARLTEAFAADAVWHGSHPLNDVKGADAIAATVWSPLRTAFPDLERRDLIFVGGNYQGRELIAAMGHYCGTFRHDWLTIPATGRFAMLRYGEVHRTVGGRIVETWGLWDLLDLMRQAGVWPIGSSLGVEGLWPGPITGDGIVLHQTDSVQGAANLAQTLAMHQTLLAYDDLAGLGRQGLQDMPQKQHWHQRMMWYGPAGIGSTRGLDGFIDDHQLPFRTAFPLSKSIPPVSPSDQAGHGTRIGEGAYSVTGGWPSRRMRHFGGGFLGLGPTGREIDMRVMDFYLHYEGLIRENWVPIDIIDVLRQMDVDVFARMRALTKGRRIES